MFVFKKAEPVVYSSEATGAEFKFRQSSDGERAKFYSYVGYEKDSNNQESLWTEYLFHPDDYYAAWLLENFDGVQQDGKAHDIKNFNLRSKADLIQQLKKADDKFSPWFKSHCEPAEKKIEEVAASGELVDAGALPAVQGQ